MGFPAWPEVKDPDGVLDYAVDWSAWLGTDTISTSEWIVPDGIVLDRSDNTTTTSTAWVSGGTDGQTYELTNRITTVAGRTCDRTLKLKIKER